MMRERTRNWGSRSAARRGATKASRYASSRLSLLISKARDKHAKCVARRDSRKGNYHHARMCAFVRGGSVSACVRACITLRHKTQTRATSPGTCTRSKHC
jgi:hypothetical protein